MGFVKDMAIEEMQRKADEGLSDSDEMRNRDYEPSSQETIDPSQSTSAGSRKSHSSSEKMSQHSDIAASMRKVSINSEDGLECRVELKRLVRAVVEYEITTSFALPTACRDNPDLIDWDKIDPFTPQITLKNGEVYDELFQYEGPQTFVDSSYDDFTCFEVKDVETGEILHDAWDESGEPDKSEEIYEKRGSYAVSGGDSCGSQLKPLTLDENQDGGMRANVETKGTYTATMTTNGG